MGNLFNLEVGDNIEIVTIYSFVLDIYGYLIFYIKKKYIQTLIVYFKEKKINDFELFS